MQHERLKHSLIILTLLSLSACNTPPTREQSFDPVQHEILQRTGHTVRWNQDTQEDRQAAQAVSDLLAKPLTADAAVQIALLNNRSLQATFEDLGIAQADLVQAGLLKNPTLSAGFGFPTTPPSATDVTFSVAMNLLDAFLIPARQKIAAAQLQQAQLHVTDAVLDLAAQTAEAYYRLQAAQRTLAAQKDIDTLADAAYDFAQRQHKAGNISDLALSRRESQRVTIELATRRAAADLAAARHRLHRLMALGAQPMTWTLAPPVDPPDPQYLDSAQVSDAALANRLDIAIARGQTRVLEQSLALAQGRLPLNVQVGAEFERDTSGQVTAGPTIGFDLPIFDQGQARTARLDALLRQSRHRLAALEADAKADVAALCDELRAAADVADFCRRRLAPARRRIVELSQQQVNAMALGIYDLLDAKQDELAADVEYAQALRDQWLALTRLTRALGGRLPTRAPGSEPTTQPAATQPDNPTPNPPHHP